MAARSLLSALCLFAGAVRAAAPAADGSIELWQHRCSGCHGDGSGPLRKRPGSRIPNLRSNEWQSAHSETQVRAIITDGKPDTRMPSFKSRLSAEQIAALAAHAKSFKPQ